MYVSVTTIPRAEYYPVQDCDLRRVTFQAVEHTTQIISGTSTDFRIINTAAVFDEMLLLLHFRPRSLVPLSAYSLFDSGYNIDTAKEFTYTLSSQKSDTKSALNPYMRLPVTMRLQADPRFNWTVAVTQIYYNPTGVIPLIIQGTGTFLNGTVMSIFTIEANITLQMLCNLRDKLAPYLQQQFSDAITAQKPSSVPAGSALPSMTLGLVQNRWQLVLTRFQIDYANSNIEEKLLVPYMGFVTAKRTGETSSVTD